MEDVLIPLLRHIDSLPCYKPIVFIVGPPGAGKTAFATALEDLATTACKRNVQSIGIDGFHYYNSYLETHTTIRDGKKRLLKTVKGSFDTFDVKKLKKYLIQFLNNDVTSWPEYDRVLHNPKENNKIISSDVLLLEGNWLLDDDSSWVDLREYCTLSIYLDVDATVLRDRLINRRLKSGYSLEESTGFVDYSDMANVKRISTVKNNSDMLLSELNGNPGDIVIKKGVEKWR